MKLDTNTCLWRYMNYSKFRGLLKKSALYFASPHQFDDRFEGFPRQLKNADCPGSLINNERLLEILEENRNHVKINCWQMNKHESDGMWKLYANSKNQESVAIQTSLKAIRKSFDIDECSQNIINIEKVKYNDEPALLHNGKYLHTAFINKRSAFEFEHELRLITDYKYTQEIEKKKGVLVKVKLEELIESVYLTPGSTPEFEEEIQSKLSLSNLKDVHVKRSFADNKIDFEFDMNGRPGTIEELKQSMKNNFLNT